LHCSDSPIEIRNSLEYTTLIFLLATRNHAANHIKMTVHLARGRSSLAARDNTRHTVLT
jgi:hypothetical protein